MRSRKVGTPDIEKLLRKGKVDELIAAALDEESSPSVRQAAVRALGRTDERAVGALSSLVGRDRVLSYSAGCALTQLVGPKAALRPLLLGHEEALARQAVKEVGGDAGPVLVDALREGDETVRLTAIGMLGHLRYQPAARAVTALLEDSAERVRAAAAELLGRIGDASAAAALASRLSDEDPEVRYHAVRSLRAVGAADSVEALRTAAADPDPDVRENAAFSLGGLAERGVPGAVDALIRVLRWGTEPWKRQSQEPGSPLRVRETRVGGLGGLAGIVGGPEAIAAAQLGSAGDPAAVEPLIDALASDGEHVQYEATCALGKLGDPRAGRRLIGFLSDHNEFLVRAAAEALGKLGATAAVDALVITLRTSGNWETRRAAALALGEIGDRQAIDALTAAAGSDPYERDDSHEDQWTRSYVVDVTCPVRDAATEALARITSAADLTADPR